MSQETVKSRLSFVSEGNRPTAQTFSNPASALSLPPKPGTRQDLLDHLQGQIRKIERTTVMLPESAGKLERRASNPAVDSPVWTLGAPEIDALLGAEGLETAGVHEVKPIIPEGGFALALTVRRVVLADMDKRQPAFILCCRATAAAHELGSIYGPGLRALGLDPDRLLLVEPAREADVLWVLEEGLKSESLALVLGSLGNVALTPARRLALAAAAHRTPCLLLTDPRSEATGATTTRWRVGPHPAAPHAFDEHAPGAPRVALRLERLRSRPVPAGALPFVVEWCDETRSFSLVSRVADRTDAPRRSIFGPG